MVIHQPLLPYSIKTSSRKLYNLSPQKGHSMFNKYSIHVIALATLSQALMCMQGEDTALVVQQVLTGNELTIQSLIDIQKKQTHLILNNVDARITSWGGKTMANDKGVLLQGSDRDAHLLTYIKVLANGYAYLFTPKLTLKITPYPDGSEDQEIESATATRYAKIVLAGNERWDKIVATNTRDFNTTQYGVMSTTITFDHTTNS